MTDIDTIKERERDADIDKAFEVSDEDCPPLPLAANTLEDFDANFAEICKPADLEEMHGAIRNALEWHDTMTGAHTNNPERLGWYATVMAQRYAELAEELITSMYMRGYRAKHFEESTDEQA